MTKPTKDCIKCIVFVIFFTMTLASADQSPETKEPIPPLLYTVLASTSGGVIGAIAGGVTGLIINDGVEKMTGLSCSGLVRPLRLDNPMLRCRFTSVLLTYSRP